MFTEWDKNRTKESCSSSRLHGSCCSQNHSQKGFTLVELIVGLLLAALVIGAASAFIIFGTNFFSQTAQRSQQQADVTNVADTVASELRLAQSVEVRIDQPLPSTLSDDQRVIFVGQDNGGTAELAHLGYLYTQKGNKDRAPYNYYGADWYNGYTISMDLNVTVEEGQPKYFELEVSAHAEDGSVTHTSSVKSFEMVNVAASSQPFASSQTNSANKEFYIIYSYWQGDVPQTVFADGDDEYNREVEWVVPTTGTYLIQCWGADGGPVQFPHVREQEQNGFGGYASGEVKLTKGTVIYLTAGGGGQYLASPESAVDGGYLNNKYYYFVQGGFNGGGDAGQTGFNTTDFRTGGGGGSDVRVLENDLQHRIIVAGGGAGNSSDLNNRKNYAGNGGGEVGEDGGQINPSKVVSGGGSQTAAGYSQYTSGVERAAGFGVGSSYHFDTVAGGGGGWYGGGNGNGAGGGSGYVLTADSHKPAGYFGNTNLYQDYYLSNTVNVTKDSGDFVAKPTSGIGGYVRVSYVSD